MLCCVGGVGARRELHGRNRNFFIFCVLGSEEEEEGASIEEDVLSEGEVPCQEVVLFWVDLEAEPDDH